MILASYLVLSLFEAYLCIIFFHFFVPWFKKNSRVSNLFIITSYVAYSIAILYTIGWFLGLPGLSRQLPGTGIAFWYMLEIICCLGKFMLLFLAREWKAGKKQEHFLLYKMLQVLASLVSIVMLGLVFKHLMGGRGFRSGYIYFVSAFAAIFNLLLCIVIEKMDRLYKDKQENSLKMQELQQKEEYYRNLEAHQQEIRIIKHDMRNHLTIVDGFLQLKNLEEAQEEVRGMLTDITTLEQKLYTENTCVNMILNTKEQRMKERGISCYYQVMRLPQKLKIRSCDVTGMLGNLLDNAIEACENCKGERYIRFSLDYRNNFLLLECENSAEHEVKQLETKKADKKHHGWGMKSIQRIVRKYGGSCEWNGQEGSFKIEISLWDGAEEAEA